MLTQTQTTPSSRKEALTISGTRDMSVSRQWSSRPSDQRFLSLDELYSHTLMQGLASRAELVHTKDLSIDTDCQSPEGLTVSVGGHRHTPSHWSFSQLCAMVGAPAGYLRSLPAALAATNLQHGLAARDDTLNLYSGQGSLRAATTPAYGRVYDHQIVAAVRRVTEGTDWKVPGVIDWSKYAHNPHVDVTKDTTTLYASDRDVYMFLVDDCHPISIGKLANGDDDLLFRGFYVWNSEVGAATFGLSTFYLRGVCQNRCLWGVEQQASIKLRHSKYAPQRLASEIFPALRQFAQGDSKLIFEGVRQAKASIVATTDDERLIFLQGHGFSKPEAKAITATVLVEELHPAASVWDFVQGITAYARGKTYQDARLALEIRAGKLLDKVA